MRVRNRTKKETGRSRKKTRVAHWLLEEGDRAIKNNQITFSKWTFCELSTSAKHYAREQTPGRASHCSGPQHPCQCARQTHGQWQGTPICARCLRKAPFWVLGLSSGQHFCLPGHKVRYHLQSSNEILCTEHSPLLSGIPYATSQATVICVP